MKKPINALWSTRLVALSITVSILVIACSSPTGPGGGTTSPDPEPLKLPGIPQNLAISNDAKGNSTLSWSSVTDAETYKAYYSGSETGDYTAISNITDTSYLLPLYGWYKVSAANQTGEGALSNAVERKEPVSTNGPAATPAFSIVPGVFDETTNIELSCTTTGAFIYYTTDGSTPIVGTSSQYVAAITVLPGETITITAIGAAPGYSNSDAASGTYHIRRWEVVGSAGFSGGEVWYVSLAIDGNGHPWIAYMDASTTPQYKATVMRFDGNSWVAHGGKGISTGVASDTLIAIDSANNVYVSYKDYSSIPTSGVASHINLTIHRT